MSDVILNKAQTIEKCIRRIRQTYQNNGGQIENNFDCQDILILNLQRACEAAIDMAAYVVRQKHLGVPQQSRDFFEILRQNNLISENSRQRMLSMVGFRNIAVHDYQSMNLDILHAIVGKHLDDFLAFSQEILKLTLSA